ncbi:MAG: PDZ domain-containing protein [Thermacetogeniaceae bacterium]
MAFPWLQILLLVTKAFFHVLMQPFYWLVVVLVWYLYRRMQMTRESLYGIKASAARVTVLSVLWGLVGGLLGSLVIIFFGISVDNVGIGYLWLLALVLMLFNPRFLCFSYAGGILALFSLLTGRPDINIPSLMGLIAVLHLVESILILTSGHYEPLPVYVSKGQGEVVGAFNLQKFWPIPLAVLMVIGSSQQIHGELIKTPSWWPLISPPGVGKPQDLVYGIFPVFAALGYGELAIARMPRDRVRRSAFYLGIFSIVLLGLSVFSSHFPKAAVIPALFSPLGHEMVIYLGRREEFRERPRFVPPRQGMMVLDVVKESPAEAAGIRSGEIIYSVGGFPVNSRSEFHHALAYARPFVTLCVAGDGGQPRRISLRLPDGVPFGVIPVPEENDPPNVSYLVESPLRNLRRRIFKR